MRLLIFLIVSLFACSTAMAQMGQMIRTALTTNNMMNTPMDGWVPFWNNVAKKWSNAPPSTASATNAQPPSAILTNLSSTGAITNLNDNQFAGEATIASIKDGALVTNVLDYISMKVIGDLFVSTNSYFTNKVLVLGVQTNKGPIFIDTLNSGTGLLQIKGDNNETAGVDLLTYGSEGAPQFYGEKWGGTRAAPSAVLATESIGSIDLYGGKTGTSLARGFGITVNAVNNWSATDTRALVHFYIGNNTGDLQGKGLVSMTAFNITNDANVYVKSNLVTTGVGDFLSSVNVGTTLTVLGTHTQAGTFTSLGNNNSFLQDVTVNGPFIANNSLRVPRGGTPTTDDFGEIAADNDAWGSFRGALQFYDGTANTFLVGVQAGDAPSNGQVLKWNTGGTITWEDDTGGGGGGPGTLPMNANQFDTNNPVSIKTGALLTNTIAHGITIPTVTPDRAAGFNGNGDITNATGVTMAELEFIGGLTSDAQTQINGKMNGQTNSAQFGQSTVLTLRDGVTVTNANLSGTTIFTNPPGSPAAFRIMHTNGLAYTEFSVPSQWLPTNRWVLSTTNVQANQVLKVLSTSISGGVATHILTNAFVAGTEVTFSDPNGDYTATDVTSAIAELVTANGSGPNASDGKVNWSQIVSVPAGFADGIDDGGGSTNVLAIGIGTADITNVVRRYVVRYNNDTNIVVDWKKTNYVVAWPSNNFTVSWVNQPDAGTPAQSVFLEIVNTNSTQAFFPTNGLNNSPVILLSAPSTNIFIFNFDGTNFWTDSGQILTSGVGDTNVFNINPVLHGATNIGNLYHVASSGSHTVTKPSAGSVAVTNFVGLIHKSSAATIELDFNAASKFSITNRITAATSLITTNGSDGQEMNVFMLGEASGGTSRSITVQPHLGHLIADEDNFATALATSFSFTLTNGNGAELSFAIRRLNGTNIMGVVTRQFKF